MDNKLKDEIGILLELCGKRDEIYPPNFYLDFLTAIPALYTLIEDVACEYANWYETMGVTELIEVLGKDWDYKDAFNYFITNIYKPKV